jgi:membrane AbrB-like protein
MVAVSGWALAGRPVVVPTSLAKVVFVILGISLGAGVTPQTIERMATWPLSLVMLVFAMTAVSVTVTLYLHYVHGWDILSALFAATPGALTQALALAADSGADLRSIATVQSVRLLILTVALPLGLAAFASTGSPPSFMTPTALGASLGELILLVVLSSFGAVLAFRLYVPGGLIVGAMVASGILHGLDIVHVNLPSVAAIASFVIMGAFIGTRFAGTDLRLMRRLLSAGLGALAVGTVVASAFGLSMAYFLSLRIGDVILAYAPGGLEAMTILSFALDLDPAYVGAHHLGRFIFLSFATPIAVTIILKMNRRGADESR